jgi:hypothetical protein
MEKMANWCIGGYWFTLAPLDHHMTNVLNLFGKS